MSVKKAVKNKLAMMAYDNISFERKARRLMKSVKEVEYALEKIGKKK